MKNVMIIGAGAIGSAVAHKCAQFNHELGNICIASRTPSKCEKIIHDIKAKGNVQDTAKTLVAEQVNAKEVSQVEQLIQKHSISIVLNVGSSYCNLSILEACKKTGACYVDSGVHEVEGRLNEKPPWYANYEWHHKDSVSNSGITAILSCGFDPGATNVFCAYVKKHLIDTIDTIDILDVNAGSHGKFFASNFDPETNLREIMEDAVYWENDHFISLPCLSKHMEYELPVVGQHRLYIVNHEEVHSISQHIPLKRITFWMGFGDHYINCFRVLLNVGMLRHDPVTTTDGQTVIPIRVLKAVLPNPSSLGAGYTGKTCIGCLIRGVKQQVKKEVFIYNICDHEQSYQEIMSQAIAYTTAVPIITTAILLAREIWHVKHMVNMEELDPDPFMQLIPEIGLDWHIIEKELV